MARIAYDKERLLSGHFLLQHLEPDDFKRLAASATVMSYPAGKTIFQKGDAGSSMMTVIRGRVKICTHSAEGKELVLDIIGGGGIFGEIALLDGEPRTADAVVVEETDLLVLDRSRFIPVFSERPDTALRLLAVMCKRLRRTNEHLQDTLFLEAPARLARYLLRLVPTASSATATGKQQDIKLSQQQLANLVGISRESVNKLLGEWRRDGFITLTTGVITLCDPEALEELALAGA